MSTMTAFVIQNAQATPTVARVPVPQILDDELLVAIKAIGVGIHDSYFLPPNITYPYPIGIEASGVVEQVGGAVTGYRVGDRVAFVSAMQPKGGTWAEYAAARSDSLIVPIPEGMSFEQAAAIPVAGNTTLRALHALPDIPAGGSVFIAGASGAIGTFAVQLARQRGWTVAASASEPNHDYLMSLGATLAVDYRQPDWTEKVRQWSGGGVDGALAIQPNTTEESMSVVRPGGTVVTVSGDQIAARSGVNVAGIAYRVDVRDELITVMNLVVSGDIRLVLERVYPFSEALDALAKVQTRRARGKVVLTLG